MKKKPVFNLLAILIGITAGLAISEFIARIEMPGPLYLSKIDLNEFQYREHNGVILWNQHSEDLENVAKEAGKNEERFRIVGLGDSIMFGSGIDSKNTYMSRLGNELEKITGKETEVVDLSQPGYGISEEDAAFDLMGVHAKPDLVIIHAWEDDLADYVVVDNVVYDAGVYTEKGFIRSIPLPLAINKFLILNSRLYQYLSIRAIIAGRNPNNENRKEPLKNINSIYVNAAGSNAKILILFSPDLSGEKIQPFKIQEDKTQFYKILTDWAADRDVETLDLGKELSGIDATEIRLDPIHFNEKGHDMILKILAGHIAGEYIEQPR